MGGFRPPTRRFSGNKFGNTKVEASSLTDGYAFSSRFERNVYLYLKADPTIEILQCQDRVLLSEAEIDYRPDFKCRVIETNEIFWAESKGFETPEWKIKKKLWRVYGPGRLDIYQGKHDRFKLTESIIPKGRKP